MNLGNSIGRKKEKEANAIFQKKSLLRTQINRMEQKPIYYIFLARTHLFYKIVLDFRQFVCK